MKDNAMEKLVIINQHEKGVIKEDDAQYDGLLTFKLEACIGVCIFGKDAEGKKVNALQHHDVFTDAEDLPRTIDELGIRNNQLKIFLVSGSDSHELGNEEILEKIEGALEKIGLNSNRRKSNTDCVAVFKNGSANLNLQLDYTPALIQPQRENKDFAVNILQITPNGISKARFGTADYFGSGYNLSEHIRVANTRLIRDEDALHSRYVDGNISEEVMVLNAKNLDLIERHFSGVKSSSSLVDGAKMAWNKLCDMQEESSPIMQPVIDNTDLATNIALLERKELRNSLNEYFFRELASIPDEIRREKSIRNDSLRGLTNYKVFYPAGHLTPELESQIQELPLSHLFINHSQEEGGNDSVSFRIRSEDLKKELRDVLGLDRRKITNLTKEKRADLLEAAPEMVIEEVLASRPKQHLITFTKTPEMTCFLEEIMAPPRASVRAVSHKLPSVDHDTGR